jgi:hypothetical protein
MLKNTVSARLTRSGEASSAAPMTAPILAAGITVLESESFRARPPERRLNQRRASSACGMGGRCKGIKFPDRRNFRVRKIIIDLGLLRRLEKT